MIPRLPMTCGEGAAQSLGREGPEPHVPATRITAKFPEIFSALLVECGGVSGFAHELDRFAREIAEPNASAALRRAARAIYQQPAGRRKKIDDRIKIADAVALFESGAANSFWAACVLIARKFSGDERKVKSIAERLRKKRKTQR